MATPGYGVTLEYGSTSTPGASTTYTSVTVIRDITPPEISASDIDATHHASPDKFKEYVAGLADGNTLDLECLYTATQYNTLQGFFREQKAYRIKFPVETGGSTNSGFTLAGYINKITPAAPIDDVMTFGLTIKLTGKPTYEDSFA